MKSSLDWILSWHPGSSWAGWIVNNECDCLMVNVELVWTLTSLVSSLFSLMTRSSNSLCIGVTCLGPAWRDVYEGKLIMDIDVYEHEWNLRRLGHMWACESWERARSTQMQIMRSKNMHLEQAEKKITENTLFLNYLILAFNFWIWLYSINLPAQ